MNTINNDINKINITIKQDKKMIILFEGWEQAIVVQESDKENQYVITFGNLAIRKFHNWKNEEEFNYGYGNYDSWDKRFDNTNELKEQLTEDLKNNEVRFGSYNTFYIEEKNLDTFIKTIKG